MLFLTKKDKLFLSDFKNPFIPNRENLPTFTCITTIKQEGHFIPKNKTEYKVWEFTEEEALQLGIHIWDEISKGIALKMSDQLIPVINETFHKKHPLNAKIIFLSTEYAKLCSSDKHAYRLILSDITFQVDGKEIYHLEFQIDKDRTIIIRMLEYDFQIGLQHATEISEDSATLHLHFPHSAVIYPVADNSQPDYLNCTLHFQDGSEHGYYVPVIKISNYELRELFEKQLNMFLPFSLLRFRDRVKNLQKNPSGKESLKKDLTAFLEELIMGLETEYNQKMLNEQQYRNYIRMVDLAIKRILHDHPDIRKEAGEMTECKLKFIEEIMEDYKDEIKASLRDDVLEEYMAELKAETEEEFKMKIRKEFLAEVKEEFMAELKAETEEEFKTKLREEFLAEVKEEFIAELKAETEEEFMAELKAEVKKALLAELKAETG